MASRYNLLVCFQFSSHFISLYFKSKSIEIRVLHLVYAIDLMVSLCHIYIYMSLSVVVANAGIYMLLRAFGFWLPPSLSARQRERYIFFYPS